MKLWNKYVITKYAGSHSGTEYWRQGMKLTTLCYIEQDERYLMLHRVKKENDLNHDKWIGVGGKLEDGETPEECLLREVQEETGYTLTQYRLRGIITFLSDEWESETMYLYTATGFTGTQCTCDEGDLVWVPKKEIESLKLCLCLLLLGGIHRALGLLVLLALASELVLHALHFVLFLLLESSHLTLGLCKVGQ